MCGFIVVLSRSGPVHEGRFRAAMDSLRHRGPDSDGLHTVEFESDVGATVHVRMGHLRLSILDPQARSDQPMIRGDHALCYNGEIYNFRDARAQLETEGARFETRGDTEVLLEGLRRHGVAILDAFIGMWALALLDKATGELILARDRFGKKPLFYATEGEVVVVASEAKAIAAYLGRPLRLKAKVVGQFLRHGYLFPQTDGSTAFEGVSDVPPGGVVRFNLHRWSATASRWFDMSAACRRPPSNEPLEEIVEDAVLRRLVADRPVGLLLSGGIDSTLILSVLAARGRLEEVRCLVGDTGSSEDAHYATLCAEAVGIQPHTVRLEYGAHTFERFLKMCRHQEKPFPLIGNAMAMAEMYDSIGATDVRVILDGTGGDEIFGGYWDRYAPYAIAEAFGNGDEAWIATADGHLADESHIHGIFRHATDSIRAGATPTAGEPMLSEIAARYCHPSVLNAATTDGLAHFSGTLAEAMTQDIADGRLNEWIWQNDRNAMMASTENRSPFLDHRLLPHVSRPYDNKFADGWNKIEARRLFDVFKPLPAQWRRQKQGFRWIGVWFLRENAASVLDMIAATPSLREHVDVDAFVDAARTDDAHLTCDLTPRLLCIAGIEQAFG